MKLNEVIGLKILILIEITDESLKERLSSFGFETGTKVEILSRIKGMFLVKVLNSVYAINDVLAEKILVEHVNG